jgi:hypothetical protein
LTKSEVRKKEKRRTKEKKDEEILATKLHENHERGKIEIRRTNGRRAKGEGNRSEVQG